MSGQFTIDQWIVGHSRFNPDKAAIHFKGTTLTYREFAEQIARAAFALANKWKLTRGDRIAVYALNCPETFVLLFAAARLGLIVVPLNWRLAVPELRFIMNDCAPKLLFVDNQFVDHGEEISADLANCQMVGIGSESSIATSLASILLEMEVEADLVVQGVSSEDPLLVVYTSGTTGTPKGAVLSQRAMQCNAQMSLHAYDMHSGDHILNVLPLFHVGGLAIQPLPGFSCGATLTLHDKFDPEDAVKTIDRSGITLVNTVPTVLQAMVRSKAWTKADLSSLKTLSIGSTDVPVSLIEAVHTRDIPVIQIYGATETGPIALYQRIDRAFDTIGSIGRTGLYCESRLVDEQGNDVRRGENGEIWIRGKNVLTRYWNNSEATRSQLTDGWFHTGDLARLDEDGNHWFADRIKHVIISGGENIYAAEIERVLRDISGISEVCVVGRPDEKWGEVPVAVIAVEDSALSDEHILSTCAEQLARFKCPKSIVRVDALPRNAMGKVVVDIVKKLVPAD